MALDDINDINKQIKELYKQLGKGAPPVFSKGDMEIARGFLKSLQLDLREVNSELSFINEAFKDSVNELTKQDQYLTQAKQSLRGISNISQKLISIKKGETEATEDQIKKLQVQAKLKFDLLEQSLKSKDLSTEQRIEIEKSIEKQKEFIVGAQEVLSIQKEINNEMGVKTFGALEDISSKIPGFRKFAKPFKDASDAAKEQARFNKLNFGNAKGMTKEQIKKAKVQRKADLEALKSGAGLNKEAIKRLGLEKVLVSKKGKALAGTYAANKAAAVGATKMVKPLTKSIKPLMAGFKILTKSLSKALGPIGLAIEILIAIIQGDKAAGELAKSMNMTYTEALATRREFTRMAEDSGEIFVTTKALQKSFILLNKSLGTNVMLNRDNLIFATKMSEMMGITDEAIVGINKLSLSTNKSMEGITGEIIAQADISATNLGVQLNEKEILEEVSKLSAATTLSLGKNPKLLAQAVTEAKALGMTMEKIEKSSQALLNFEQSITSELKAELLIGRNLNLEKARLASLNNDIVTLAREISSQIGTSADFARMNRIQQQALAESVGMSRDELAETLFIQENIGAATGDAAKDRKLLLASLVKELGVEGARRKLEKDGIQNLEKQTSTQERFNAMLDKLTEIAVQVGEPLLEIISPIADLVGYLLPKITGALQPIIGVLQMLFLGLKGIGQFIGSLFGGEGDYAATFSEAGNAFVTGVNRGFDVMPIGKDGYLSDMGLNLGEVTGFGRETTLLGENSLFYGGSNANSNNSSIREQTDYMRMSSQRQEELLKQLTIQNEALIAEAQETNRSYLYGD